MKYVRELREYVSSRKTVVTLGKFDGVHKGHRMLLRKMKELEAERGLETVVFTFDMPPQARIEGVSGKTLMTNDERFHFLEQMGVDVVVECRFTPQLRSMSAEQFIRDILCGRLNAGAVVAGTDFHFGKNRSGNPEVLRQAGKLYGFDVFVIDKEIDPDTGREISSTYIREELAKGNIEKVNQLLGYPYFLEGTIRHGRRIGHQIGIPTINLIPEASKMLPPEGVYFSETLIGTGRYRGITNIGKNPTVEGNTLTVETHLIGCDEELYGKKARVSLIQFHRPEIRFPSVEALKAQMMKDIQAAGK